MVHLYIIFYLVLFKEVEINILNGATPSNSLRDHCGGFTTSRSKSFLINLKNYRSLLLTTPHCRSNAYRGTLPHTPSFTPCLFDLPSPFLIGFDNWIFEADLVYLLPFGAIMGFSQCDLITRYLLLYPTTNFNVFYTQCFRFYGKTLEINSRHYLKTLINIL